MMTFVPRAQEIYKHFKGNLYQIVTVAEHTETGETLVVYQALYGDFKVYARPLSMFCSKVDKEKYPDATQEYRFELQNSWCGNVEQTDSGVKEVQPVADTEKPEAVVTIQETPIELEITVETTTAVEPEAEEELSLDPMLLAFLDAETYAEKLNILSGMHHRITDDMITTMAIASDIEIEEGDLENRYTQLKNCLTTLGKYEITR